MLGAHTITRRGNIPLYLCTQRERRESDTTRSNFNHLGLSEFLSRFLFSAKKKQKKQENKKEEKQKKENIVSKPNNNNNNNYRHR